MRLILSVFVLVLLSFSLFANSDPCLVSKHCDDLVKEWEAPVLRSKALQSFVAEVYALALRSQKYCSNVQKADINAEYKSVARSAMKTISSTIKRLNGLKREAAKANLNPDSYKAILEKTINEMGQFLGAGHVIIPGGGIVPVIPPPPKNPINNCRGAGDDITQDCMDALETLQDCGAISSGQAILGRLTCNSAGQQEENACNLANLMGEVHSPARTNMDADAQAACSDIDEERTRQLNQKESVQGR
jgi:hypothetical protein